MMKHSISALIAGLIFCALGALQAHAGNIDPNNRHAWSTNAGWIDFETSNGSVTVQDDCLTGLAWAENIGWIKLGNDNGGPYDNTAANNWGVNKDGSGNLSGFGWSKNVGWVNFNPSHSQVTIDAAGSFDGYAWSENAGWIHFKNASPAYNVVTAYRPASTTTTTTIPATVTTPTIASVMYVTSFATAGTYTAGDIIPIIVRFSKTVWVSGTPHLVLKIGETPVMAYYSAGSATEMLTFLYTVAAGDMISNLEYWSEWALELNDGRIWDNMDNDVILDLPAPGAPGSLSGDIALSLDTDYPVYRFYSPGLLKHFYTIDENEKNHLIDNMSAVWQFEYIAYYAFHPLQYKAASRLQRNTLQAVHRFYSETLQTHLFTLDENEKEHLIANAADVWRYEGPAFYVPADNQEGTVPVYRFYSEALTVHLYTADENEKNHLIETAGDVWRFEGIAYYVYP